MKKNNKPEQSSKEDKSIEVEGVVTETHPNMRYTVLIDFKGIGHSVLCYVSGKMRKKYIEIKKGDKVKVEISLYDIDNGIITWRLTDRQKLPLPTAA